jgi:hypothetical protein
MNMMRKRSGRVDEHDEEEKKTDVEQSRKRDSE